VLDAIFSEHGLIGWQKRRCWDDHIAAARTTLRLTADRCSNTAILTITIIDITTQNCPFAQKFWVSNSQHLSSSCVVTRYCTIRCLTSKMLISTAISLLSTAAFSTFVSALPATTPNILARAGGPAIVPIPPTCSVTDPLPASSSASYVPAPSTSNALLYSAYYPSFSTNKTAMAQQCLEQCYGYGYHVECKTAFWAENIVVPAGYYGTAGGQLSTGCLFFNRPLMNGDFVPAPEGQGTHSFARNIAC
jgi:hypothetical protein